uniref:Sak single strand annealing protein n=1 Tax=Holdemanella biformis TaxID=1735 RepID=UPI00265DA3D8|nr:DUF1071 domain-containing protein [Holdemanella biformis]
MEQNNKSVFETLSAINVSGKTEKKNGLTYLSWAYAWGELCKVYPTATYKVHERDTQWGPCNYFTDGRTAWVKVSVTIGDLTHTEMLPIMDYRNKSIPLDKVTSCDANKAIQRCITKAVARFGLGLYVYAGEDLPSSVEYSDPIQAQPVQQPVEKAVQKSAQSQVPVKKDTRLITAEMVDIIRKIVGEHGVTGNFVDFICESYKVCKLEDLRIYQFNHIKQNIEKLKTMFDAKRKKRLADITVDPAAVKPKDMGTTFADVIAPPQQDKAEGEEVSFESLGLSPADLDALTECGNVFN